MELEIAKGLFTDYPSYTTARAYAMEALDAAESGDIAKQELAKILQTLENYLKGTA